MQLLSSLIGWRILQHAGQLELRYRDLLSPLFFLAFLPLVTLTLLVVVITTPSTDASGVSLLVTLISLMAVGCGVAWLFAPHYLVWQHSIYLTQEGQLLLARHFVRRDGLVTPQLVPASGLHFSAYQHSDWIWPRYQLYAVHNAIPDLSLFPANHWASRRTATAIRAALSAYILQHDLAFSLGSLPTRTD